MFNVKHDISILAYGQKISTLYKGDKEEQYENKLHLPLYGTKLFLLLPVLFLCVSIDHA